ncbi:3-hydroxyacyl-CoA dehydrogenase NAD-binding domain-containing protein [Saccharopolyspora erythraea]|uniref:3-hydroxyacyl-CoA dehydrogenase NAD-binding domain-containing protein n=1 Tax=Saccharopolyspora erythraea TaxID=1836 RepID=UPI0020138E8E|nr:3-hydroxyacyl-CoA dehydrogenase NAD-binding domain-containing protein [Saccharopolyspora erythraea]
MSPEWSPGGWNTVAVVGAGTIGLGWAALFSAHGLKVRITDPRDDLASVVADSMPLLAESMGRETDELLAGIEIADNLADAVADADLVQENGPERLEFKQHLFADIARHAPPHAVLASSSSGIVATAIADHLPDEVARRLLIAHPFNPPQVVPLVEIVPGERTEERVTEAATAFYTALGKTPVRLRKEIPGFVANRLQSAVMREATHLVLEGVVRADELDTVMKSSLGGRYAAIGPFESFHLGGGPGGIRHMMRHLGAGMAERWKELGQPEPTQSDIALVVEQTEDAYGAGPDAYRTRARTRDRKQTAINSISQTEGD